MREMTADLRARSAKRIASDIEELSGPRFTASSDSICRYAYTDEYARTLEFFDDAFAGLGFTVGRDPVGTFVARNRPLGTPVLGLGSHCDSNRNGGRYDGTLGVVTALEIARMNKEQGLNLPLQVVSFLEEEGSGFGQVLLGSRIMAGLISDEELADVRALDDGRSFFDHARDAGLDPDRWRDCARSLHDLVGWIEVHIEQGRVLQDTGNQLGLVSAIAGYVHGDLTVRGRADHAGATPMEMRIDAGLIAAETALELQRLAISAGHGTVGTVGEIVLDPGLINVVPGGARLSLDIRGTNDAAVHAVASEITAFAQRATETCGGRVEYRERTRVPATPMDDRILSALLAASEQAASAVREMPSGAAHDTMCVAAHCPAAMVFVPCRDGISHSPLEHAEPDDAAVAAEVTLRAISGLLETEI